MTRTAGKLTVIVEKLMQPTVERLLRDAEVGWSIFPGGGHGHHGSHRLGATEVVGDFAIVRFESVMNDRAKALHLADRLQTEHLTRQAGLIWAEGVELLDLKGA